MLPFMDISAIRSLADEIIFQAEVKQSQRVAMETAHVIVLPLW